MFSLTKFWNDEEGAATIEMVVLMAASVGAGIATMDVVSAGVENLANDISDVLSNIEITTSFDPPEEEVVTQ